MATMSAFTLSSMRQTVRRGARQAMQGYDRSGRSCLPSTSAASSSTHRPYTSSALVSDDKEGNQRQQAPWKKRAASSTSSMPGRRFGQPMPSTHPHLFPQRYDLLGGAEPMLADEQGQVPVAEDELTPGIPASEYEERRRRLMVRLPEGSLVICLAGRVKMMSNAIFYRFRQSSNFLYLTGFQEPEAALILEKNSSSRGYRMAMFVPPTDASDELWNGPRTGIDGATSVFGADQAFEMEPKAFLQHVKQLLPSYDHIYIDPAPQPNNARGMSATRKTPSLLNLLAPFTAKKVDLDATLKALGDPSRCRPLADEVHHLRLIKSDNELRLMRQAGRVGATAMMETMQACQAGRSEWQLQSIFEASCAMQGAQRPAYVPVVATGANALTIHYVRNESVCEAGQLVCMDAGCELDGYVSDITRAFPVDGRFTSPQRDLYGAVLNVLKACTALVGEDQGYTLSGLHRRSVEMLNAELRRLGFTPPPGYLERYLYPHALSHWLGMDLHDTPTIERNTELKSGMCLSVEPAVYCGIGMPGVPKAFEGLGIRIEDDVALYGPSSRIVLNPETPKEIEDVEATCTGFWQRPSTLSASLLHGTASSASSRKQEGMVL